MDPGAARRDDRLRRHPLHRRRLASARRRHLRRVLGHYVRERGSGTLMEALAKMTILPARRLEAIAPAMARKGRIEVGADADLTVFDPATVIDRATYESPAQRSAGIHSWSCGVFVVRDGAEVAGVFPRAADPRRARRARPAQAPAATAIAGDSARRLRRPAGRHDSLDSIESRLSRGAHEIIRASPVHPRLPGLFWPSPLRSRRASRPSPAASRSRSRPRPEAADGRQRPGHDARSGATSTSRPPPTPRARPR